MIAPSARLLARAPNGHDGAARIDAGRSDRAPGGFNVIAAPPAFTGNLVGVSVEDVLLAAPDVVIASDSSFAASVRDLAAWRGVPAVRMGRVFVAPDLPFAWFDSPPSLNRLLGLQWLVRILHREHFRSRSGRA